MIRVVAGDLASVPADAVVRPATTRLEPMSPALLRLDAAAGPKFMEQIRVRRELAVGSAVVTGAGDLAAEFVIHVITGTAPDDVTTDTVRRALDAALWQCTQWNLSVLACPIPAAGNLSAEGALASLLGVLRPHLRNATHPATVLLVPADPAEADLINARIG